MEKSDKFLIVLALIIIAGYILFSSLSWSFGPDYFYITNTAKVLQALDIYCNESTQAVIVMRNAGTESINLGNCLPNSATGTQIACGEITITRTDGGAMKGSLSRELLKPNEILIFKDTCTILGTQRICSYKFSGNFSAITNTFSVTCPKPI